MLEFRLAVWLWVLNNRKPVFQTEAVTHTPEGKGRAPKVAEFPGVVKAGGIVVNVVMDIGGVGMGGYNKGVAAFRPAHTELVADTVCFFGCYLSGFKGLPHLVGDNIRVRFLLLACRGLILCFC